MINLKNDSNFMEKISKNLIYYYELYTGKKYNNTDINSIKDVVNFLNGEVLYVDIKDEYKVDKMLYLKENDNFVIIIDKSLLKKKFISNQKEIILDMMWKFIQTNIHFDLYANALIYPENSDINEIEINYLLNKTYKKIM